MTRFVSAREAIARIHDYDTLAHCGFVGFSVPEYLLETLAQKYRETGHPHSLTLIKSIGVSDKKGHGSDHLSQKGLVDTIITSHVGLEPGLAERIYHNDCRAYLLPFGTIIKLYRAQASHAPGVWTATGLGTFADPRQEGSKANEKTVQSGKDIVRIATVHGNEYLYYDPIAIDVCFIRGTYADEDGNISLEKEALLSDQLEVAMATHASGGIVIAEVEGVLPSGTLNPRSVKIHRFMVDYVIPSPKEYHTQSLSPKGYRPELTGETRKAPVTMTPLPLDARKICARRAVKEFHHGDLINLGIGIPQGAATVAAEEGLSQEFILSTESGVLGGIPLTGMGMGASINPEAIYKTADILDVYTGGCLDCTVLGLAEMDAQGNVNVSKFNGRVVGPGGFIDISQNTKTIIFLGTFTAGGLREEIRDGTLIITHEGTYKKFKKDVEQITFSARHAMERQQNVLVITERAVFRLTQNGLVLIEIAPGIELQKDILNQMDFKPAISTNLQTMGYEIFKP